MAGSIETQPSGLRWNLDRVAPQDRKMTPGIKNIQISSVKSYGY
jgi:hypothetical protein